MSVAACDSTPGTLKLSLNGPPTLLCNEKMANAATSHSPNSRNGCRAELRPRRYRNALIAVLLVAPAELRDERTIRHPAEIPLTGHCDGCRSPISGASMLVATVFP